MHPNQSPKRRRRDVQLTGEALETRELLTGGAGNTFAIIPGVVTTAGQTAAVKVTIDTTHFTIPKNRVVLGIDVVAQPNSTVKPTVSSVTDAAGHKVNGIVHAKYDRHLQASNVTPGGPTSAIVAPLTLDRNAKGPQTFTVNVSGVNKTTGKFLLGFYLPGDANGDGVVDKTDVSAVKKALNSLASNPAGKYNFDADVNRDGKVTLSDLNYAIQNVGVKTTISPVISANLDATNDPTLAGRTTNKSTATFTGAASPGASIKFESASGGAPTTTTADAKGNYTISVPLASGANTFNISTLDGFGQSITGSIAPVTYNTNPAITPSGAANLITQAGLGTASTSSSSSSSSTTK